MEKSVEQTVIIGGETLSKPVWRDKRHTKPAANPFDGERGHVVIWYQDYECKYVEKQKAWVISASIPKGERISSAKTSLR
jgi:hypothetical protein